MRVCVVGSGGREHALAHVLGRDAEVVVTPGNPGIPGSVSTPPEEVDSELFVVGPEAPLVDGLADRLRAAGRLVFGPGADGARLEGSKAWMKEVLVDAGVPTAQHGAFTDETAALAFLDTMADLFVVKTDGLAAGKGVVVTEERAEAVDAVRSYLSGDAFGDAGRTVVIEEGLSGPELSLLAICDGDNAVPLAPAQDFKRIGDGDIGPNTGGMGAYSPVPVATGAIIDSLMDDAVGPTIAALRRQDIDYRGVLYCGLMFTPSGPKVLEYNVRFGDPEAQVVLPRMAGSLTDLLAAAAEGSLGAAPAFDEGAAVTVVCATDGYPASPRTGDTIHGLDEANALDDVTVFCAGVAASDGRLTTAGGRVLAVTGQGPTIDAARDRAYAGADTISWSGIQRRTDIAAAPTPADTAD
ncbi:MAG TPA: phosphoribosylamine--glycine ligase [Acidimicrobiales bacterium]|nr:phosphoribosylamine--glycine ligase [Actinomycetes bacterium]MDP6105028.1 phosphoribosylamine--glycine ligase [Acidimicrobiales bacterium]MCP4843879.1 phosphoribosylamine--glycine ligase [Actinomycetes bacterium]MDP6239627.1 phosphoribosylamine--glycine ligase [Acidimicrobiales bacterium]MDP7124825.1 phosphoribosylamine--glycine ligase [Acidimicrobiales bacterium]